MEETKGEEVQEEEEVMIEEEEESEGEEEESDDPVKSIKAFKKLVVGLLEDNDMSDKRACKMEIIDFLNLLNIFNDKGVHFK
jgi:hypothetical protein